jgi:hypothetical protein
MAKQKKKNKAPSKSKAPRYILFGLSALALGVSAYLGLKYYRKKKAQSASTDETYVSSTGSKSQILWRDDSLPLSIGSSGPKVLQLQRKLNLKFNAGLEEDGLFGPLTSKATQAAGIKVPVSQEAFSKLTDGEATLVFDPRSIANRIWKFSNAKELEGTLAALREIRNIENYKSVNSFLKNISDSATGTQRTIVNHLLTYAFTTSEAAKVQLRAEFLRIGLVETDGRWALSGFSRIRRRLLTVRDTYVRDSIGNRIKVKSGTLLGRELYSQGAMTTFLAVDGTRGLVPATHVRYI